MQKFRRLDGRGSLPILYREGFQKIVLRNLRRFDPYMGCCVSCPADCDVSSVANLSGSSIRAEMCSTNSAASPNLNPVAGLISPQADTSDQPTVPRAR